MSIEYLRSLYPNADLHIQHLQQGNEQLYSVIYANLPYPTTIYYSYSTIIAVCYGGYNLHTIPLDGLSHTSHKHLSYILDLISPVKYTQYISETAWGSILESVYTIESDTESDIE